MEVLFVLIGIFGSIFGFVTWFEWEESRIKTTKKSTPVPNDGPYRTAVPVALTPEPIKQPKPKRVPFKMADMKLSNSMKTFLMILPICICAVIIGFLYDLTIPSLGIRTGMGFATGFIGLYFAFSIVVHLDKCMSGRN